MYAQDINNTIEAAIELLCNIINCNNFFFYKSY